MPLRRDCTWRDHALAGDEHAPAGRAAVLEALAATGAEVTAVRGKSDVPRERLHALPPEDRIALPGGQLVVVHGDQVLPAARRHERLRQQYPHAWVTARPFGGSSLAVNRTVL